MRLWKRTRTALDVRGAKSHDCRFTRLNSSCAEDAPSSVRSASWHAPEHAGWCRAEPLQGHCRPACGYLAASTALRCPRAMKCVGSVEVAFEASLLHTDHSRRSGAALLSCLSNSNRCAVSRCHAFGCSSSFTNSSVLALLSCGVRRLVIPPLGGALERLIPPEGGTTVLGGARRYRRPLSRPRSRSMAAWMSSGRLQGCSMASRYMSQTVRVPSGALAKLTGRARCRGWRRTPCRRPRENGWP